MADGFCAKNFLIQVEDTPAGGTYTTIGAIQSPSLTINGEDVDITSQSSNGYRQILSGCGVTSIDFSGNGVLTDSTQQQQVHDACIAKTVLNYQIVSDKGDSYVGPFKCSSFERSGDHNTEEKFSISLASAGEITYSAS